MINFANSRPSASNFKSFSQSQEQFFLAVGQNNFGNKIPLLKVQSEKNVSHLCDGESDQIWDFQKAVQERWQYWHHLETFGV